MEEINSLQAGDKGVIPFHWEIEFPEVFNRNSPGFDAIIGNPPFAGRTTLSESSHENYIDWLKEIHDESHGNADVVAHFFRRAFGMLRENGCFGLIATKTIGQGDTRSTGLRWICTHGGTIYAARKRIKWPGEAAVVVSVVQVSNSKMSPPFELDGRQVPIITAYLFHAGGHENPVVLSGNQQKSFQGAVVVGMGFTFDDSDSKGVASPLSAMEDLVRKDSRNRDRIFPYIGGEEICDSPSQAPHRFIINFGNLSEADARNGWPDLMKIVEEKVKPSRTDRTKSWSNDKQKRAEKWWQFSRTAKDLYLAIAGMNRVLAINCGATPHMSFTFLPTEMVYAHSLVVLPFSTYSAFCALQSRVHETWVRFFASSLEDRLRYTPTDAFETYPFASGYENNATLESCGKDYYEHRTAIMLKNGEGLTKTYNRFHDPEERSADILKLRELHGKMDEAVLASHGWTNISTTCGFGLDYLDANDDEMPSDLPSTLWFGTAEEALSFASRIGGQGRRLPWRYRWSDDVRDDLLARLLVLNAKNGTENGGPTKSTKPVAHKSKSEAECDTLFVRGEEA